VAHLLFGGHPDAALGAETVAFFGVKQITVAFVAITLSLFIWGLAVRAKGHETSLLSPELGSEGRAEQVWVYFASPMRQWQ
jgi:hypothetical protein